MKPFTLSPASKTANEDKTESVLDNTNNNENILTCASICSGIGAFEQALTNLNIVHTNQYMIEIDKDARATYLANHSVNHVYEDLTKINSKTIEYADLILLSMPCQSFSMQGKRKGFYDTRGTLTFDALNIIKHKKPKFIIYENVKGLVNHDGGNTFQVILESFKDLKYKVKYQVLNSKNFDSAQNRERLFIVCIREDIDQEFFFTEPNSVTVTKKISDYIEKGADFSKHLYDASGRVPFGAKRDTDIIKLYKLPHVKFASDQRICSTEGVAPTIVASSAKTKFVDMVNGGIFRYLTLNEMAAIQGFPADFKFPVSNTKKKRQIGNSITVSVLEAIIKNLLI